MIRSSANESYSSRTALGAMDTLSGRSLGRYHLLEQLGEGGMATVYKAYDTRLERSVAVKVIRTDFGQDSQFLSRFDREAKALARLSHPHIVHVLDVGETGGIPFVVMDFVGGGTLKQRLGHPMDPAAAARLLAPIARALEYAHAQGIIHRDVKPANVLMAEDGRAMLSDFGIAKLLDPQAASTGLTMTGVGIGTPDYMAPEQGLGQATPQTDLYALGVVFYEMVTGRRPYEGDTPIAVLLKHATDPLPRPRDLVPNLSAETEQVLLRALAKKPEDRYPNMAAFSAALDHLADATTPQGIGPLPASGKTGRTLIMTVGLAAAGLGTCAGLLAVGWVMLGMLRSPATSAATPAAAMPIAQASAIPVTLTALPPTSIAALSERLAPSATPALSRAPSWSQTAMVWLRSTSLAASSWLGRTTRSLRWMISGSIRLKSPMPCTRVV
jgi:serine/threonine protein kinase